MVFIKPISYEVRIGPASERNTEFAREIVRLLVLYTFVKLQIHEILMPILCNLGQHRRECLQFYGSSYLWPKLLQIDVKSLWHMDDGRKRYILTYKY